MNAPEPPDPFEFARVMWPDVRFYGKQREAVYSAMENDETYVPAGNMLGKDFVTGFICLYAFLTRHPCRIVTTSAKDDHLRVLWGEINRFIQTAKYPLEAKKGGPLIVNHQDIKKVVRGEVCKISYLTGMVASPQSIAAMQGHHVADVGDGIPRAFFVSDESSSVPDEYYQKAKTWFHRMIAIGNTWPCNNFFFRAVEGTPDRKDKGGDIPRPKGEPGYHRKVIHITADESPNVRYAKAEIAAGKRPSGRVILPGVKPWSRYARDRKQLDAAEQAVILDAKFYKGKAIRLFPAAWLENAARLAENLRNAPRRARTMGVDPAEGGDKSAWCVCDDFGVLDLVSMQTPDTDDIYHTTIEFIRRWQLDPEMVFFDRGGGGKQHADRLRKAGFEVRTVAFGEGVVPGPKRGMTPFSRRLEENEVRYEYRLRRDQLYGELSVSLDPQGPRGGFAIPAEFHEIHTQLAPIPKTWDSGGRLQLPPKTRRPGERVNEMKPTLVELIGHSPDEADALALAHYGLIEDRYRPEAGAV